MTRSAPIETSNSTAGDRLLVMLFLAGLFHLIVILGISFTPPSPESALAPTLEVLLVSDTLPDSEPGREIAYLAQRSQQGSGTPEQITRLPRPAEGSVDQIGPQDPPSTAAGADQSPGGAVAWLTATGPGLRSATDKPGRALPAAPPARWQLAGDAVLVPSGADDAALRLKGRERRELLVTPATRSAGTAIYLDAWKRRIEQVGTLHFPAAARRRALSGNPVVEVALDAGGNLLEVRVRRSSGHPELDQAALEILRLATPFEAFPPELAVQHDLLRFAYEWQFVAGRLAGSAVELPPP
ncbi:MAG: energy transducer TonB [Gammaproteobacteria bacterium]|nr:energy transducer TonB [Gammaproteobacteria bacterium]